MVKKAAMEGDTTDHARAKASRTFKKRKDCVKKKTMELATLCGTKACVVCFGPNGELETWPENPSDVRAVLQMHDDYARNGRRGSTINYNAELESVEAGSREKGYSCWEDRWLRGLSKEELANFLESVEDKLRSVEARIEFLEKMKIEQQNWSSMNEIYDEMAEAEMMTGSLWPQPLQAAMNESYDEMAEAGMMIGGLLPQPLQAAMNESYDEMAEAGMMIGGLLPQPLQAAMNESYDEMAEAEMMIGSLLPQPLQALNYESTPAEPVEFGYFGDAPMFPIGISTWALLNCYGDDASSGCASYW